MKKIWIGIGVVLLVLIIASNIVQMLVPMYETPISVLTAGIVLILPMGALAVMFGMNMDINDVKSAFSKKPNNARKAKKIKEDREALLIFVLMELCFVAAFLYGGVRSVKAIGDIIDGPIERVVYESEIIKERHHGRRYNRTYYYLTGYLDEGKSEEVKLLVAEDKLEEVDSVVMKSNWIYKSEGKCKVCYFDHLDILYEADMIGIEEP